MYVQAERKQRRDVAATKATEAKNKIRTNYLKMLAIQQLKGEQSMFRTKEFLFIVKKEFNYLS